ncbi:MAG: hypothetical protein RRY79_06930 [Clostridia bacterium]
MNGIILKAAEFLKFNFNSFEYFKFRELGKNYRRENFERKSKVPSLNLNRSGGIDRFNIPEVLTGSKRIGFYPVLDSAGFYCTVFGIYKLGNYINKKFVTQTATRPKIKKITF